MAEQKNSLILNVGGRSVEWDLSPENAVYLAQAMVQSLGPADRDLERG